MSATVRAGIYSLLALLMFFGGLMYLSHMLPDLEGFFIALALHLAFAGGMLGKKTKNDTLTDEEIQLGILVSYIFAIFMVLTAHFTGWRSAQSPFVAVMMTGAGLLLGYFIIRNLEDLLSPKHTKKRR